MLKRITTFGLFAGMLLLCRPIFAQASPTATALTNLQVGGGFTYLRTDYGQKGDKGLTVFGDYDIGVHWGAEAEYHWSSLQTPDQVSENSLVVGPRYIIRRNRFKFYGKGLFGLGRISIPPAHVLETDVVFGAGGGVEYLYGHHITLRPIDVEYQHWSFGSGLTPFAITAGVAYRFH